MPEHTHAHILTIEVDPGIATSLRSGLEREGYQLTWKDKREDGIAFTQALNPGLFILDVRLLDGAMRPQN